MSAGTSAGAGSDAAAASELADLPRESERIERLLDELRATAGPPAWERVEELMRRLLGLYGAGLRRLLQLVADGGALGDPVRDRLCDDPLVSSLLLLHGLHPLSVVERVRRALEEVRAHLETSGRVPKGGAGVAGFELIELDGGTARLRFAGSWDGCDSTRAAVEHAVERAIEQAAPEIARVEIEGAVGHLAGDAQGDHAGPRRSETLVQIDLRRPRVASPMPPRPAPPKEQP